MPAALQSLCQKASCCACTQMHKLKQVASHVADSTGACSSACCASPTAHSYRTADPYNSGRPRERAWISQCKLCCVLSHTHAQLCISATSGSYALSSARIIHFCALCAVGAAPDAFKGLRPASDWTVLCPGTSFRLTLYCCCTNAGVAARCCSCWACSLQQESNHLQQGALQ